MPTQHPVRAIAGPETSNRTIDAAIALYDAVTRGHPLHPDTEPMVARACWRTAAEVGPDDTQLMALAHKHARPLTSEEVAHGLMAERFGHHD